MATPVLPHLPQSWSELTWQQLCDCWSVKMRYGGNADIARCAAFLALALGSRFKVQGSRLDERTGEQVYILQPETLNLKPETYVVTARELAHIAKEALPWFDFPYGDLGDKEERDEKGNVTKEAREGVAGYVSGMHDAMVLPLDEVKVSGFKFQVSSKRFALPQAACNSLTWQQYRAIQNIAPILFQENTSEEQVMQMQAEFLAHCLVPRSLALLDSSGKTIKIRPHYVYEYDADRAERLVSFWKKKLMVSSFKFQVSRPETWTMKPETSVSASVLFHICFQMYQTAVSYYSKVYPLLFSDSGKNDPLRDALTGEVGTINTIMKYAGYAEQQQVYDSNLPFVLDILNTMTKEAQEIEKMKAKKK